MAETQESHKTGWTAAVPAPMPTPQAYSDADSCIQGEGVRSAFLSSLGDSNVEYSRSIVPEALI